MATLFFSLLWFWLGLFLSFFVNNSPFQFQESFINFIFGTIFVHTRNEFVFCEWKYTLVKTIYNMFYQIINMESKTFCVYTILTVIIYILHQTTVSSYKMEIFNELLSKLKYHFTFHSIHHHPKYAMLH